MESPRDGEPSQSGRRKGGRSKHPSPDTARNIAHLQTVGFGGQIAQRGEPAANPRSSEIRGTTAKQRGIDSRDNRRWLGRKTLPRKSAAADKPLAALQPCTSRSGGLLAPVACRAARPRTSVASAKGEADQRFCRVVRRKWIPNKKIRLKGNLVGSAHPGKIQNLTPTCFRVKPLGVPLFANL